MSTDKKYEPEFTDQSWNEMSKLLDKEMPQKKKRKFPIFFLLGTILLLIATFFAYPLLTKNTTTTSIVAGIDHHTDVKNNEQIVPVEKNEKKNTSSTNETNTDITKESKVRQNLQSEKSKIHNINNASNHKIANLTSPSELNKASISSSEKSMPSTSFSSSKLTATLSTSLQTYKNVTAKVKDNAEDVSSSSTSIGSSQILKTRMVSPVMGAKEARSIQTINAIQKNIAQLLSIKRPLPVLKPFVTEPIDAIDIKMAVDRWNFGIGAAYASNFEKDMRGPGISTRIDFNMSNSWAVEGGAGLFRHSITSERSALKDADAILSDDLATGITENFNEASKQEAVFNYLSSLKNQTQLVTSLGIKRSLYATFYIAAGAKHRYTIARSSELLEGADSPLMNADEDFFDQIDSQSYLRNNFISAYVGLGYNPLKHLSFRVEADFSGQSYLTTPADATINKRTSFLQAEMMYRF